MDKDITALYIEHVHNSQIKKGVCMRGYHDNKYGRPGHLVTGVSCHEGGSYVENPAVLSLIVSKVFSCLQVA